MTSPSLTPDTPIATAMVAAQGQRRGYDEAVEQQQDAAADLDHPCRDHPDLRVGQAEALEGVELPAEGEELRQAADHERDAEDAASQRATFEREDATGGLADRGRAGILPDFAAFRTAA